MKILFYFILICVLLSCSNKTETPSGIIPPKEMSEILWDVIRAQVLANEVSKKDSSVDVDMQTKTFTKTRDLGLTLRTELCSSHRTL